jgi:hypothetical protein
MRRHPVNAGLLGQRGKAQGRIDEVAQNLALLCLLLPEFDRL